MPKSFLSFFSPAKVNLFFKILSKRKDGYHEIASLYQAISLGDLLHIRLSKKDSLSCSDLAIPQDKNLVNKALNLYREKTKLAFSAEIILEKKIPLQAGLGGGSSNAATTLFAINELLGRPVSMDELKKLAGEIGSDVAFFLSSGTALCTGRGEIFENIANPKKISAYIVKPPFGLSTVEVYKNVKLDQLEENSVAKALKSYEMGDFTFFNDLEKSAFALNPELQKIKERLFSLGFFKVLMTGSGSAFYCLIENEPKFCDGLDFYKVEGIWRNSDKWYSLA